MSSNLAHGRAPTGITYADRPAQVLHEARTIRPKDDNCVILYDFIRDARREETTASGLIVPHSARVPERGEACWATVVAAGPGRWLDKWLDQERGSSHIGSRHYVDNEIKAGQRVLVQGPTCGDAVMIDGLEHRIVRADVIIGVDEDG